jgi:hypothetical protein
MHMRTFFRLMQVRKPKAQQLSGSKWCKICDKRTNAVRDSAINARK